MLSTNPVRSVLSLAFLALPFVSPAADWPQWRGPLRTGHVPDGVAVPAKLPPEPKTLWRVKVGEGFAGPVVAGGRVFLSDNQDMKETLRAFDATTGRELWRAAIDSAVGDKQGPPGPRCTPLVDGDRVYAQSMQGQLRCLGTKDGRELWQASYVKDFNADFIGETGEAQGAVRHGYDAAPLIDGDRLITLAGSTNGGGAVVCLDKKSGKVVWKSHSDQAGYSAPIIANIGGVKQVVAFMCTTLSGLDAASGRVLWQVPVKTKFSRHVTTPVVINDIVIVASHEWGLMGTKVTKAGGEFKTSQAWINKEAAMNFSSPVALGNYLYGLGPNKNVICVDGVTGKIEWSKDGLFLLGRGNSVGYFTVMGKNILTLTDSGQLILFAVDPKEYREINRTQVCGQTWAAPAYADGKIYVRDGVKTGGELICAALLP